MVGDVPAFGTVAIRRSVARFGRGSATGFVDAVERHRRGRAVHGRAGRLYELRGQTRSRALTQPTTEFGSKAGIVDPDRSNRLHFAPALPIFLRPSGDMPADAADRRVLDPDRAHPLPLQSAGASTALAFHPRPRAGASRSTHVAVLTSRSQQPVISSSVSSPYVDRRAGRVSGRVYHEPIRNSSAR